MGVLPTANATSRICSTQSWEPNIYFPPPTLPTFWKDSWKVRPMAITSPTLFIWVVSVGCNRGQGGMARQGE